MEIEFDHIKSYIHVPKDDAYVVNSTLPNFLERFAKLTPEKNAFVFISTDAPREIITWKEFYDKSQDVARAFIQLGVKERELIGINIRSSPEWLYMTFGAIMAGAVPFSFRCTYADGSDVIAIMKKLETCSTVVIDPGLDGCNWKIFEKLLKGHKSDGSAQSETMSFLRYLICVDRENAVDDVLTVGRFMSMDTNQVVLPSINPSDIAFLCQTSGSTGMPKFVAHSHRSFIWCYPAPTDQNRPKSVIFNDRPFQWMGGFPSNFLRGDTWVTRSGFCPDPEDYCSFLIETVKQEECAILLGLPSMILDLCDRKEQLKDDWPVKVVATGGQPITKKFYDAARQICDMLVLGYGSTELISIALAIVTSPQSFKDYSSGNPSQGIEIKIIDENSEIVPVNTRGEIYVRSKYPFAEYYNDPEATREVKTPDGWYKTDDIGTLSGDGLLFVEGRKSDVVIYDAMNVYPHAMEAIIKMCPGVKDAVIVGIPHEKVYQEVCACFIKEPGCDLDEEKLRQFCEEMYNVKSANLKVLPKYYIMMETFPCTFTGKISRKVTKEIAIGLLRQNGH